MKPIADKKFYRNCIEIEETGFNSHQSCYSDNGFCTDILLSDTDLNCLASEVFNLTDEWNKKAIQQVCI